MDLDLLPQHLEIPDNVKDLSLEQITPLYEEWLRRVPKQAPQGSEFMKRLKLFRDSCIYIWEYNRVKGKGSLGTTIFADMTVDEMEHFDDIEPGVMEPSNYSVRSSYIGPYTGARDRDRSKADAATSWKKKASPQGTDKKGISRADASLNWRSDDRSEKTQRL